jgi:hypothetical protein
VPALLRTGGTASATATLLLFVVWIGQPCSATQPTRLLLVRFRFAAASGFLGSAARKASACAVFTYKKGQLPLICPGSMGIYLLWCFGWKRAQAIGLAGQQKFFPVGCARWLHVQLFP